MARLLDKYLRLVEQKKEKKRLELLEKTLKALDEISNEVYFNQAYVFGSILKKKKFYYDSDIDIAVFGLDNKDFFYFMSRVTDMIGRDVDIVQLEGHRLKDKIIREGLLWKKQN